MWVVPSLDVVVSYNDATPRKWTSGRGNPTNKAMKLLAAAVTAHVEQPDDER
jgi:DNA-binding transcriptional regulator YiaG